MARKKTGNQYRIKKARPKGGVNLLSVLKWTTACTGVFLIFAGLAYSFLWVYDLAVETPAFAAKTLEVKGNAHVSREEILEKAGVAEGVNVLSVSLTAARERLLSDPWIAGAKVRFQLPDKIFIEVTEHVPMAVLDLGRRFLMDTNGEIFKLADDGDPEGLPLVRGLEFSDISVASQPMSPPYKAVVEFLKARRESEWALPAAAVAEVAVDRDLGLTLVAGDPAVTVRLGFDRYPEKLVRLHGVFSMNTSQGVGLKAVDLLDLDRVVILPVKAETVKKGRRRSEA
ncbi:MAG: FtsQ-type POTRA domain-containing protein [Proteobacteria bacterium]|nr:FtsQ-type POTRA domain-containing protein [Pseudomonadota bacterium]